MKKNEKVLPLECVKTLSELYPEIWDKVDCSFEKAKAFTNEHTLNSSVYLIHGLSLWRKNKQIYEIDRELCYLLGQNDSLSDEVPVEAFENMPYDCFYVKLPKDFLKISKLKNNQGTFSDLKINGFLVFKLGEILDFVNIFDDMSALNMGFSLEKGLTLNQSCLKTLQCNEGVLKVINLFLQIVLYLCADNAEIEENEVQKDIYKPIPKDKKPQDSFKEIRKWEVGYRYGSTIRKTKKHSKSQSLPNKTDRAGIGAGTKKRPHSRKGHWHHFWAGSEKQGNRKLVLHWVAPTVVNAEYNDNVPTIHKVKQ